MSKFIVPECVHKDCRPFVNKLFELMSEWDGIDALVLFGSSITSHFRKGKSDVDFLIVTQLEDNDEFNERLSNIIYSCLEVQSIDFDVFCIKTTDELSHPNKYGWLLTGLYNSKSYCIVRRS